MNLTSIFCTFFLLVDIKLTSYIFQEKKIRKSESVLRVMLQFLLQFLLQAVGQKA